MDGLDRAVAAGVAETVEVSEAGVEAVARWLCNQAEYHDQNWRLYIVRAKIVIDIYLKAAA